MENGQKTISDLFESRRTFNIPKYQRAYAWEDRQLQDFIADLKNQNLDKDYFFGTILLQIQDTEGSFKIIDVVDGQQRITTLVIFLRALLRILSENGDDTAISEETYISYKGEYKLRVLDYDSEFFKSHIMEDTPIESLEVSTPSQRRLSAAKKFFESELSKLPIDVLREFYVKIERAKVLTYSVASNAEATLIFETTNDRGKMLTSLEKVKSFLMYKLYITAQNPEHHLNVLQENFGEVYKSYDAMTENLTGVAENEVLRYHYIAFVAKSLDRIQVGHFNHISLIKNEVERLSSNVDTYKEATDFIEAYGEGVKQTFALMDRIAKSADDDLMNLFYLRRTASFTPLLLVALKYDSPDEAKFKRVTKLLEILSFRVYGIRKRKTTNVSIINRLNSLARNFVGDYDKLASSLQDLIGEYCSDYDFEVRLSSSTFYEDISINDMFYLLWRYENYLRVKAAPSKPEISYRRRIPFSVEHIISQNPRVTPNWMTSDFQQNYLHSLGNIVLDTVSENSSKSNLDFNTKNDHFYSESSFLSQQELVIFLNEETHEWDVNSLLTRERKIIDFALQCWDHKAV